MYGLSLCVGQPSRKNTCMSSNLCKLFCTGCSAAGNAPAARGVRAAETLRWGSSRTGRRALWRYGAEAARQGSTHGTPERRDRSTHSTPGGGRAGAAARGSGGRAGAASARYCCAVNAAYMRTAAAALTLRESTLPTIGARRAHRRWRPPVGAAPSLPRRARAPPSRGDRGRHGRALHRGAVGPCAARLQISDGVGDVSHDGYPQVLDRACRGLADGRVHLRGAALGQHEADGTRRLSGARDRADVARIGDLIEHDHGAAATHQLGEIHVRVGIHLSDDALVIESARQLSEIVAVDDLHVQSGEHRRRPPGRSRRSGARGGARRAAPRGRGCGRTQADRWAAAVVAWRAAAASRDHASCRAAALRAAWAATAAAGTWAAAGAPAGATAAASAWGSALMRGSVRGRRRRHAPSSRAPAARRVQHLPRPSPSRRGRRRAAPRARAPRGWPHRRCGRIEQVVQAEDLEHLAQVAVADGAARPTVGLPHPLREGGESDGGVEVVGQRVEEGVAVRAKLLGAGASTSTRPVSRSRAMRACACSMEASENASGWR